MNAMVPFQGPIAEYARVNDHPTHAVLLSGASVVSYRKTRQVWIDLARVRG
jgi:hypothetical protein